LPDAPTLSPSCIQELLGDIFASTRPSKKYTNMSGNII
jgi:hypothetical protein